MVHPSPVAPISISNIAWPKESDDEAIDLSRRLGFMGIELAPGKVFSSSNGLAEACAYRERLGELDLCIPAFQAIVFGVEDCALFGTDAQRANLSRHLEKVARLAGAAGAGACVFGAPKLRDPGELRPEAAFGQAVEFFAALAPAYEAEHCALTFEANAAHYGCKFVTHTDEAIALVKTVDRPGIRLQLDTGTIALNDEPESVIEAAAPLTGHFHASEPDLVPVGSSRTDHRALGRRLREAGYDGWRSVEMRACEDWQGAMRRAANVMAAAYS